MATDVDVQYFSHLNGLVLGNNWGDLIRLLDKALVTGIAFTEITAASITDQGDVHITLYSAHNALLFQVVELSGFTPNSLNQKYRIKGTPSATELILKSSTAISEKNITTKGVGKLASLGYEIIFRDQNDVKRVYRAKNPRAEHPFIRVDESLTSPDGTTGVYNSSYAKSAMVGLLENMTHIDDYENPEVLQLPLNTADFSKNWKIKGTGGSCFRGWSKWYFATNQGTQIREADSIPGGDRSFTLIGDSNTFYLLNSQPALSSTKRLNGCGLFKSSLNSGVIKNWFMMSNQTSLSATEYTYNVTGFLPLFRGDPVSRFFTTRHDIISPLSNTTEGIPIVVNYNSGGGNVFASSHVCALEIPFYDAEGYLRGTLSHVHYAGKNISNYSSTTPLISDNSMYICDSAYRDLSDTSIGGLYFYLGEL